MTSDGTPPPIPAEWLWGWDPTPGIVSVWAQPNGLAHVWRRSPSTGELVREQARFRPWMLLDRLDDLAHLGAALAREGDARAAVTWRELEGPGQLRFLVSAADGHALSRAVLQGASQRLGRALVEQHALQLPTAGLACSMYWQRSKTTFAVSLLDHVLAPGDLSFGPAEALGICAELACAPQTAAPTAWVAVSDHCPVRVPLKF